MLTRELEKLSNKGHTEARKLVNSIKPLTKDRIVHHIDGNPTNNDLSNLIILDRKSHYYVHRVMGGIRKTGSKRPRPSMAKLESLIHLYNNNIWIDTF